ncbi:hypothetical protein [Clavibacter zhangzhiyongii]|uniref:hypothetical protein n=1 Tax=Clavibacter zhangzhiyongii TaxID=2768071 RepID=UPI0039E10A58
MSNIEGEEEWNVWVRPRRSIPSILTRTIVRLSGIGREGISGPWSTTYVAFSVGHLDAVIAALRSPHQREGEAGSDDVRIHLVATIGERLRQNKAFYRHRDRQDFRDDEMMPEFVVPLIFSERAARALVRVINAVPRGDRAILLNPRRVLVFGFWRGSDLTFRDALISDDPCICDEEFRQGLIEDFERYRDDLAAH